MNNLYLAILYCLLSVFYLYLGFDLPIGWKLSAETFFFSLLLSGLFYYFLIYKKQNQSNKHQSPFFLFFTVIFLAYTASSGMAFLGDSQIPRLKLYLKLYHYSALLFLFYMYSKFSPRGFFLGSILIGSGIFYSWHYLGITLREFPLFIYLLSGLLSANFSLRNILHYSSLPLVLLFISALFSTLLSPIPYTALFSVIHFLGAIALISYCRTDENRKETEKELFLSGFGIYLFTAVIFIIFTIIIRSSPDKLIDHTIGGFNINSLGGFIAVFCPICFYFMEHKNLFLRLSAGIGLILGIILLYYTHSRASILGLFGGSVAYIILWMQRNESAGIIFSKYWKIILSIISVISTVFFFLFRGSSWLNLESLQIRIQIWKTFLSQTLYHALWPGFGPGAMASLSHLNPGSPAEEVAYINFVNSFGIDMHAHNLFIQYFFSFGLIGFVCLLFFCGMVFQSLYRRGREMSSSMEYSLILAIMTSFLIQESFDYTLADPFLIFFLAPICGFLLIPDETLQKTHSVNTIGWGFMINSVAILISVFVCYDFITFQKTLKAISKYAIFDKEGNVGIKKTITSDPQFSALEEMTAGLWENPFDFRRFQLKAAMLRLSGKDEEAFGMYQKCLKGYPLNSFCKRKLQETCNKNEIKCIQNSYESEAELTDPYKLYNQKKVQ